MKKIFLVIYFLHLIVYPSFAQWTQMPGGIGTNQSVLSLASVGNNIFAGTNGVGSLFLSTNNGNSWTTVNNGLPTACSIYSIVVSGTNIFVGTYEHGIFKSSNNGTRWTSANNGLNITPRTTLIVSGSYLFAGTYGSGVYISTNNGENWTSANNGLTESSIHTFIISGTNLFTGTTGGVFTSINNGTSWTLVNNGLTNLNVWSLAISGINLFAGTNMGVFLSTNNGIHWDAVNNGLTNPFVYAFAVSATNIFLGTNVGVFLSTNNGTSWFNKNQGFDVNPSLEALLVSNNYIYAGTDIYSVWCRSLSDILGIKNINTNFPNEYSMFQNYPNPFNPSTVIKFAIPMDSRIHGNDRVVLKVYDILGKEVETLVNEKKSPEIYEVTFNGSSLASGIYFYTLTAGNFIETKKMLMIK